MTIDEAILRFPNDASFQFMLRNYNGYAFHSFMVYEGFQIPVFSWSNQFRVFTSSVSSVYIPIFSSVEAIREFLISNNIHVSSYDGNIYFFKLVDKSKKVFGYYSLRPSSGSNGLFGMSNSVTDNVFSNVSYSTGYRFGFVSYDDLFLHCLSHYLNNDFYFFRLNSMQYDAYDFNIHDYGDIYDYTVFIHFLGYVIFPSCCYPNFAPIVQILGGTPSSDQLTNLKSICQLLGVDTSENGLKDCDLMKEYLKRLVLNFGNTPSTEPNDNLKSICHFLGVDTSENGLSGCDLSKDYVKRDGLMLGATYA